MSVEKQCVSVVTLLHGESQFIPLIKDNFRGLLDTQTLELVVVDDGPVSLASEFSDGRSAFLILTSCILIPN